MDIQAAHALLSRRVGSAVGPVETGRVECWVEIDGNEIANASEYLRDAPELRFDCLSNLTGVDYPGKGQIQIVYNLMSYSLGHELTLKVNVDRERPAVPTVQGVWPAANWLEREAYDLLGIDFIGHPDLRRILLPDDWIGHPLRKDYVEAPEYHGIATIRESMLRIPERS
jgi:NADH-quinone oxidoreductase subunit C